MNAKKVHVLINCLKCILTHQSSRVCFSIIPNIFDNIILCVCISMIRTSITTYARTMRPLSTHQPWSLIYATHRIIYFSCVLFPAVMVVILDKSQNKIHRHIIISFLYNCIVFIYSNNIDSVQRYMRIIVMGTLGGMDSDLGMEFIDWNGFFH